MGRWGGSSPADSLHGVTLERDLCGTALLKLDRHVPVHGTEPCFSHVLGRTQPHTVAVGGLDQPSFWHSGFRLISSKVFFFFSTSLFFSFRFGLVNNAAKAEGVL